MIGKTKTHQPTKDYTHQPSTTSQPSQKINQGSRKRSISSQLKRKQECQNQTNPLLNCTKTCSIKKQPRPHLHPNQLIKATKVEGSSTINNLVSVQRRYANCPKEDLSFCKDKPSFLKAIRFLAFQTVHNKQGGLACQIFLLFFIIIFFIHK